MYQNTWNVLKYFLLNIELKIKEEQSKQIKPESVLSILSSIDFCFASKNIPLIFN